MAGMQPSIGDYFQRHIARENESRQQYVRQQAAEVRQADIEAAGRSVRANLHVDEPVVVSELSSTRNPAPREERLPRWNREAPIRPELPATPPASMLDGINDNGNGEASGGSMSTEEIISSLQDQLQNKEREQRESKREIERLRQRIRDKENEMQRLRASQLMALHQGLLDEVRRLREQYNEQKSILDEVLEEKNEVTRRLDEKETEIDGLRQHLWQARAEMQEQQQQQIMQQVPQPAPRSDGAVDGGDNRTLGRMLTGQHSRSNRNRRGGTGSQRRGPTEIRVASLRSPRIDSFIRVPTGLAYLGGA